MNASRDGRRAAVALLVAAAVCGYLVATAQSLAFTMVLVVVVVACGVMVEPRNVILFAAVLVPLRNLDAFLGSVVPGNMGAADVALTVFAVSAFVRPAVRAQKGVVRLALVTLGCITLAVALVSMLQSGYIGEGVRKIGRMLLVGACVLGAVRSLTWEDAQRTASALVYAVAVASLLGMAMMLGSIPSAGAAEAGGLVRLWAGSVDPNHFAILLGMGVVVAASWPGHDLRRSWWTGALVMMVLALLLTLSRGGLLGAIAGMAAVGGLVWANRMKGVMMPTGRGLLVVAGLLTCAALVLYLVAPGVLDFVALRYGGLATPETDPTAALRLRFWDAGAHLLAQHPVIGVGPGAYSLALVKEGFFTRGWEAHNSILEIAVEIGYAGSLPIVLMAAGAGLAAMRRTLGAHVGSDTHRLQLVGLTGAFIAGVAGSMSVSNFLYSSGFAVAAVLLAVGCSDHTTDFQEDSET